MSLLNSPNSDVRHYALLTIATYTYYMDVEMPADLIKMNILNLLAEAYPISFKNPKYIGSLLLLLSNIAVDNKEIANLIF